VVADDLTGAMDAGHEFAARGTETVLTLGGEGIEPIEGIGGTEDVESTEGVEGIESGVLVVDTGSRSARAAEAIRVVEAAIEAHSAGVVYKKIDSTLRGNVVPEIDAAIAASGADLALLAPAFPATGRTTMGGTHLIESVPVSEALEDSDENPTSAHLPTLLADSAYPVSTCPVERVDRGPEAIGESLSGTERPAIVACDGRTEAHLEAIARAAAGADGNVLYVGSAGLARHVRFPGDGSGGREASGGEPTDGESADSGSTASDRRGTRRVLGIAGSANPWTTAQVAALPDERVVVFDAQRAVTDLDAAAAEASARAIEALSKEGTTVVTSAPDGGAIGRTREAGAAAGAAEGVGERIERALAALAGEVYTECPPDGLLLTGGAVAASVLDELDAAGIRFTGEAIERGVPVGTIVGGRADGAAVVTKAGGFGTERTIANCLARLGEGNENHE
jgi:uncharacterized protein YgbK (DUF1537 family)